MNYYFINEIPIFHAIHKGNSEIVDLLAKNKSLFTIGAKSALHYAIKENQPDICRVLIKNGAEKESKDARDRTPLDLAKLSDDPTIELLLLSSTLPNSVNGIEFLNFINRQLDEETQKANDQIDNPPENLNETIDFLGYLYAKLIRFDQLVQYKLVDNPTLLATSESTESSESKVIAEQLKQMWSQKQQNTSEMTKKLESELSSPLGYHIIEQWNKMAQEQVEFFTSLVNSPPMPEANSDKLKTLKTTRTAPYQAKLNKFLLSEIFEESDGQLKQKVNELMELIEGHKSPKAEKTQARSSSPKKRRQTNKS